VKFHVHAILGKLDATNRTEAVSMAVKQGLILLPTGD
jgi:DNA-binding NarL/FixJ family response regulator